MSLLTQLANGQVPEVPFSVSIETQSIVKLSVAAVLVAIIIILTSAIVKGKK